MTARRSVLVTLATALLACSAGMLRAQSGSPVKPSTAREPDTGSVNLPPVGYGSLKQDDIALRVQILGGVTVRVVPLDEGVIRLLSPDSYRALRDLLESKRTDLDALEQRFRLPKYSLWYVSFFGQEQGEARFSPQELTITGAGRDYRPLEILPLSPGFGTQRLGQRGQAHAIYLFDGQLDVSQPLVVRVETSEAGGWDQTLQRIERERALVRSRAARAAKTESR
jgi:hypothetical protein